MRGVSMRVCELGGGDVRERCRDVRMGKRRAGLLVGLCVIGSHCKLAVDIEGIAAGVLWGGGRADGTLSARRRQRGGRGIPAMERARCARNRRRTDKIGRVGSRSGQRSACSEERAGSGEPPTRSLP